MTQTDISCTTTARLFFFPLLDNKMIQLSITVMALGALHSSACLALSRFLDDEGGGRVAQFIILTIVSYLNSLTNNLSVMQDGRIPLLVLLITRWSNRIGPGHCTDSATAGSNPAGTPCKARRARLRSGSMQTFLDTPDHFVLLLVKSSESSPLSSLLRVGCSSFGSRASGRAP